MKRMEKNGQAAANAEEFGEEADKVMPLKQDEVESMMPIYAVVVMSWAFQYLLDLLWIPLVAYFQDLDLDIHNLGVVFAANLGMRIVPNVLATRAGVKTDLICMCVGFIGFVVNFIYPSDFWAICVMSGAGGMTFTRAHLSVHAKVAAGNGPHNTERLTLAAKWSGSARNTGTVVAYILPVVMYGHWPSDNPGDRWRPVVVTGMIMTSLYLVLALYVHRIAAAAAVKQVAESPQGQGIVEEANTPIPWIDWVLAGAFCFTELMQNIQASVIPTTMNRVFKVPLALGGGMQAMGQLLSAVVLAYLAKGGFKLLTKRPINLVVSFAGTFIAWCLIAAETMFLPDFKVLFICTLYFYYVAVYTAQVAMLECLTGVLSLQNSIVVMGGAEIVGCGFSLVGGYIGPALMGVDKSAPFIMQTGISLIATLVLALTLGHRATTQMVVCQTEDQYVEGLAKLMKRRPSLRNSLSGLQLLRDRQETYIRVEKEFRKRSSENLVAMEEAAVAAEDATAQEAATAQAAEKPNQDLAEPLLDEQKKTLNHKRGNSENVPITDTVSSTFKGRQYKKALVSFELAALDLDTSDHVVDSSGVKTLVRTHRRGVSVS